VVAVPGNMKTGGPAKTADELTPKAETMTADERDLYGETFLSFATTLTSMQSSGIDSSAARRVATLPRRHRRRVAPQLVRMPKRCSASLGKAVS
jgi:hypothetical protein